MLCQGEIDGSWHSSIATDWRARNGTWGSMIMAETRNYMTCEATHSVCQFFWVHVEFVRASNGSCGAKICEQLQPSTVRQTIDFYSACCCHIVFLEKWKYTAAQCQDSFAHSKTKPEKSWKESTSSYSKISMLRIENL